MGYALVRAVGELKLEGIAKKGSLKELRKKAENYKKKHPRARLAIVKTPIFSIVEKI